MALPITASREQNPLRPLRGQKRKLPAAHRATRGFENITQPEEPPPSRLASLRRQHHQHLAAFHARIGFDLGDLGNLLGDALEHVHA